MGQKLTGYVSRYIDGEYVNLRPGDDAPDWVTNPELLSDDDTTKGRDELVARAAELGIEIEDQYTDAEIEALIEAAE